MQDKIDQMPVCDFLNGPDFKKIYKGFEFVHPGGECLAGTSLKIRQTAIIQKLVCNAMKHAGNSI